MPLNGEEECQKIKEAFGRAVVVIGEGTVHVLIYQLEERYNIKIGSTPCSSIEEIEKALLDIAGTGADLFISRMRSFMR